MRQGCIDCTLKHLYQAEINLREARFGYPTHEFRGLAHLAEATEEVERLSTDLAHDLNDLRKQIEQQPGVTFDADVWAEKVLALDGLLPEEGEGAASVLASAPAAYGFDADSATAQIKADQDEMFKRSDGRIAVFPQPELTDDAEVEDYVPLDKLEVK